MGTPDDHLLTPSPGGRVLLDLPQRDRFFDGVVLGKLLTQRFYALVVIRLGLVPFFEYDGVQA